MTQLEYAKKQKITPLMEEIAKSESLAPEIIMDRVSKGLIVIPLNVDRRITKPCGIGEGLRTKVNANIGTSPDSNNLNHEIEKLKIAILHGSDTVMDLSIGEDLGNTRKTLLSRSCVPFGTVPIYEIATRAIAEKKAISKIDIKDILSVLEEQAKEGVDFFTIHAGLTYNTLKILKDETRVMDIVSRGGAFIAEWMVANNRENPFYQHFDRILDIARKWDITLSLGDGMRPGSVIDATDRAQIEELITLGQLAKKANDTGVQVMIEGPGHVPINQIETNIKLEKELCNNRPFYVLGPLVTDIAPGYDHIVGAIGGAMAASFGADFLCYLTPSEHLRLPSINDVKDGVIVSKIAAHAADVAKGVQGAKSRDRMMSEARKKRDWAKQIALAIDPERAASIRKESKPKKEDVCTMCGDFCSIKITENSLEQLAKLKG